MKRAMNMNFIRTAALGLLSAFALAGCGGGADTSENPVTGGNAAPADYSGPQPANADIQAFRVEFWENIRSTNRCGNCHVVGNQSPTFARSDDVNAAYQQATGIINRDDPALSALVVKVGGGHNCWLPDPGACASILTRWITSWVGASASGGRQIQLVAPTPKDPGTSKRFPTTPADGTAQFQTGWNALYGIFTGVGNCLNCHRSTSATAQSPYFASADPAEAYLAALPKIDLNNPAASRFVVRLRNESHNCWTASCANDAQALQNAIQQMSDGVTAAGVDPSLVTSKALTMFEGTVASGGNRFENNLIALYEFKTGSGNTALDTSGVEPGAHLQISGSVGTDFEWVGGWGVMFKTPASKAQASTNTSRKFQQMIAATGEYSIEAWVIPGNVTQEDARIISYSGSNTTRNFTMGQTLYNYDFFNRSTATGLNGTPALSTDDADERLQASLQHVVMTFDPVNGRRIYVNGEFTGDVDGAGGGTLGEWDSSFAFVLGNEVSGQRPWAGVVRLVAIHNRALTLPQIQQNFAAGVGQKFFMLFGIEHIVNVPRSYILFETTQYDSAGYLFTNPKFVSLDAAARPGNIPLKGMRIGLNGAEPHVGQAYRLLDMTITDDSYSPATGAPISSVGTIIGLEKGPQSDEFFLCFDQLGSRQNVCSEFAAGIPQSRDFGTRPSDIGMRTFDEINATLAAVTGVDPNTQSVRDMFLAVRQSLPATPDFQAFLASHQASIAQLAIEYCHVMTDTPGLRPGFYGSFNPFPPSLTAVNAATLTDPVVAKALGTGLVSQPDATIVSNELQDLVANVCAGDCTTSAEVVLAAKSVCAAALGSAASLVK